MSKKRREKGEGSVYRRKDGRCVGEYEDANGKRRYVSGKTKAEVRAKLRRLLADRDEGVAYDSENLTVGGYLDRWLGALKGSVRDRTWRRHEEVVRLHLKPTLGGAKLDKLNALQIQNAYNQRLDEGLSPRSVEIIHVTLHKALKQAVRGRWYPATWGRGGHAAEATEAGDNAAHPAAAQGAARNGTKRRTLRVVGAGLQDGDAQR
jgi:integrase